MLTNPYFRPSLPNCAKQSPTRTPYLEQLRSLKQQAQRMGKIEVAAALAGLINRVKARGAL